MFEELVISSEIAAFPSRQLFLDTFPAVIWPPFIFSSWSFRLFAFFKLMVSTPSVTVTLTRLETQPCQEKQQKPKLMGQWPQPAWNHSYPAACFCLSFLSFLPSSLPPFLSLPLPLSFSSSLPPLSLILSSFLIFFRFLPTVLFFPSQEPHMNPLGAPLGIISLL